MNTAWIMLVIAGLLEVCWAIGLKYTYGFTRFWPSVVTVIAIPVSLYLLSQSAKVIPIGTAYSVWVGIGALGASILGIFLFQEPATALRIGFLLLLVIAIAGLKFTAN